MPPNPFAAVPAPTALGVTLLGLSATLLAVDIMGTIVLDRDRPGANDKIATAVAAVQGQTGSQRPGGSGVPARRVAPARPIVDAHAARARRPAAPPDRAIDVHIDPVAMTAKRLAFEPLLLESVQVRLQQTSARQTVTPMSGEPGVRHLMAQPSIGIAQSSPSAAQEGSVDLSRAEPAPLVDLRSVRRFVMRELKSKDKHACVISAMTYPTDGRRVVVDLVYRDARGRWAEKAVVRRGTSAMKLIGVKQRALPDKAVVASSIVPGP